MLGNAFGTDVISGSGSGIGIGVRVATVGTTGIGSSVVGGQQLESRVREIANEMSNFTASGFREINMGFLL
jgi:hypothetical protein